MPTADGRIKGITVPDVVWLERPKPLWHVYVNGQTVTRRRLCDEVVNYWSARGSGDATERRVRGVRAWERIGVLHFQTTGHFESYGPALALAEALRAHGPADWSIEVVRFEVPR
jgi:hypothetical protein